MPYEWTPAPSPRGLSRARLWPHKSMTPEGFVWFIAITAILLCVPLIPLLGSFALWGVLPFLLVALAGVWIGLQRNQRDMNLSEELELSPDRIAIIRHNARGPDQQWDANPYWVEVTLHPKGKVENYLTLRGSDREVELGTFLSPEERLSLHAELRSRLVAVRAPG
jgi:uncharacterized membrane protein